METPTQPLVLSLFGFHSTVIKINTVIIFDNHEKAKILNIYFKYNVRNFRLEEIFILICVRFFSETEKFNVLKFNCRNRKRLQKPRNRSINCTNVMLETMKWLMPKNSRRY